MVLQYTIEQVREPTWSEQRRDESVYARRGNERKELRGRGRKNVAAMGGDERQRAANGRGWKKTTHSEERGLARS